MTEQRGRVWSCKIGEAFDLPRGADAPLRQAVQEAYRKLTGKEDAHCFSGWGADWDDAELEVMGRLRRKVEDPK